MTKTLAVKVVNLRDRLIKANVLLRELGSFGLLAEEDNYPSLKECKRFWRDVRALEKENKMNTDELTIKQVREIQNMLGGSANNKQDTSIELDTPVIIRTVTHYYTGIVKKITSSDILLSEAAWIADTGQFSKALKEGFGSSAEIEPYPDTCIVMRGAMVDCCRWLHKLPR